MAESRKRWMRPEMIILVRNKPEETILETCKGGTTLGDPNNVNRECLNNIPPDLNCLDCNSIAPS